MSARSCVFRNFILRAATLFTAILILGTAVRSEPVLGEKEAKLGQEAAAQIAKEHKLSDNAADLKTVREIGERIAAVANSKEVPALYGSSKVTPFQYQFNIIEEPDVNAFSVPGGYIYVYRGLLDFVQSEHELAGVIAHEIVHAAHHHMVYLLEKQASLNNQIAIALLASIMSGARASDVGNIVLGAQLYQIARLNGYGMQAERDADYGAIIYMRDAGYNPVGLLTFLERLAKRPEMVDWGIYRSHPLDAQRVAAAKKVIQDLGIPIKRRETTRAIKAEVKVDTVDGKEIPGVYIAGTLIYRPAATESKTSADIAKETADAINHVLDSNVQMYEIKTDPSGYGVLVRDKPLLVVSDADAKLMGKTPQEVSKTAADAIRAVVWKQIVDTVH
ncbi:MAG: M48 family metalloprotease [Armatimonadota bacterium]|nr:M48 family metalloprotease [Armatimonadota bacterium]